jgi:hypothetical protein
LEYQLEYCIPLDYPFAFDLPALFVTMIGSELPIASGGDRQKSADSVEKNRQWFPQQKSMRLRLKSLLSREVAGLRFHVAAS